MESVLTAVLKTAIQECINSGLAKDFNPQKHLKKLKANKHQAKERRLDNIEKAKK